jgi:hypothetical protein
MVFFVVFCKLLAFYHSNAKGTRENADAVKHVLTCI